MVKKIVIGADHGGFKLKENIKKTLEKAGYSVIDSGTHSDAPCDYPLIGYDAAKKVSDKKAAEGIVICKSGIGMSIIANKLPGVRAGLCLTIGDAVSARQHNDANILVLSASRTSGKKGIEITKKWLSTKALKGRHARRVRQMIDIEKKVFKKRRTK